MSSILRFAEYLLMVACCGVVLRAGPDENVVFRSDVSLIRIDAQVVDRGNRAITGLRKEDFVLREEGRPQQIRNFANEEMSVDVLFLIDVSSSMRPHVERIASAAHEAFSVLGEQDRVGIMVFDRMSRVRMPFRSGPSSAENEFDRLLRQESFHGGTDITRGMLDAAAYIRREGRREARRAIVILTDDETEFNRDDAGVLVALERADSVMSALIAPDAMGTHGGYGRPQGGGGTWGSGIPGGVILGRRGGYPGGPGSGGGYGHHTRSAGTAEIARGSGGDSMAVGDAYALETTLARIRQRYALHFYLPADVKPAQERHVEVQLASAARDRYPDAEVRFRRTYRVPDGATPGPAGPPDADPIVVTRAGSEPAKGTADNGVAVNSGLKRRRAVNEDGSPVGVAAQSGSGAAPAPEVLRAPDSAAPARGWRRVDEQTGPTQGPLIRDSAKPTGVATAPVPAKDAGKAGAQDVKKDGQDPPPANPGGWPRAKPDNSQ